VKVVRPQWIRDKLVSVLLQGALKNDPELPDVPNALDFVKSPDDRKVLELHFTQKTAARPIIAPWEVPADRLAILDKAFKALATDQEFLAEAEKTRQEISLVPSEEVEKVVKLIVDTPPEIADRYAKAFAPAQK
jgi:hypothetical protein